MAIGEPLVRLKMPNAMFTFYTAPASPAAIRIDIRSITFANKDEDVRPRVWLYLVSVGDSPSEDNGLIEGTEQWRVPEGRNIDYDTWKVLKPGGTIQGYSDGNVTLFIDGAVWKS